MAEKRPAVEVYLDSIIAPVHGSHSERPTFGGWLIDVYIDGVRHIGRVMHQPGDCAKGWNQSDRQTRSKLGE